MMHETRSLIKILIVDDHDVYRDGLQMLLEKDKSMVICGHATNGKQLIELARKKNPDVIITDLRMPVMNGVEAIRYLAGWNPWMGVLALSMFDDESLVIDALEAGALGYIIKNAQRGEIIDAVRTVYAGEPYYCLSTSAQLATKIAKSDFNPYHLRTPVAFDTREKQIISMVCNEWSTREMADSLAMNSRTVERIRAGILEKMRVKSAAGIAIYAVKNELFLR